MEKTTIQISNTVWKQLNDYKLKPSESFEDVIKRLIKEEGTGETAPKK